MHKERENRKNKDQNMKTKRKEKRRKRDEIKEDSSDEKIDFENYKKPHPQRESSLIGGKEEKELIGGKVFKKKIKINK